MFYILSFIVALLYVFFDVNYFLRTIFTVVIGRLFEKRVKITDPTTIYGFCFTQDLDIAGRHMNNARFVRDLDFSRFHFYDRTGLYAEMRRRHTDAVQAATSIRYRRVIPIFTFYKIESQLLYWDEKAFYVEQRFVTPHDGFVRAAVLSKQVMLRARADEMVTTLCGGQVEKPALTPDLDLWIKSMEASSERLRPHKS
ncbi:protein THEM6 [Homalodisca vitripennis]|uniref:protein THEM6 n=1 Tax=Homalodisca vitripennis TaxID=197043 RepID=UPI001EEA09FF|nr:protein THEM6 [Homalodisca vitripennis]